MTVTEFTFLGLGLLLGVAAGAALVEVIRARPPAPREVRVTVAQEAIPRRSRTLADDAFVQTPAEPAYGGPADRRSISLGPPGGLPDRRTSVRVAVPARTGPGLPAAPLATHVGTEGVGEGPRRIVLSSRGPLGHTTATLTRVPVSGGPDPVLAALQARRPGAMAEARTASPTVATSPSAAAQTATAVLDRQAAMPASPGPAPAPVASAGPEADRRATPGAPSPAAADAGPCADLRRVADERCEIATRARAGASEAEDALRAAQRAYDEHESRAEAATRGADPREVRAAKDAAQAAFRLARDRAARTDDVEAAARAWLAEINRINTDAREATMVVARERAAAREVAVRLERLAVEADAARIAAETAEATCLAAREAVAECDERVATDPSARHAEAEPVPGIAAALFMDETPPGGALDREGTPRILRLVRGDRSALIETVAAMAGDDPEERRRWQLAISDLVDAILADTIAASVLHFPDDHPFWGPFTLTQDREIVGALSSLGYRFDGLGGWVDGRMPSQRDLSLALGYAGLDPMRMRHWPTEAEMAALFEEVTVAADEHLAAVAGDLTLGEMVTMLGKRADGLAEVWNHWGRLRPVLLEER